MICGWLRDTDTMPLADILWLLNNQNTNSQDQSISRSTFDQWKRNLLTAAHLLVPKTKNQKVNKTVAAVVVPTIAWA